MEFLKVWAKHNFYYIRYISVYIQPRYFYLIFRSVNGNNMNRVILHSVRPSFWKKRAFSHAPRCGSTESGCEISVPWWLILADLGKMTSVWSRDRDTGDTSELCRQQVRNMYRTNCNLQNHPLEVIGLQRSDQTSSNHSIDILLLWLNNHLWYKWWRHQCTHTTSSLLGYPIISDDGLMYIIETLWKSVWISNRSLHSFNNSVLVQ